MTDKCEICGTEGDDRRTLHIGCMWNMVEVSTLFTENQETKMYELVMCKGCRARLLQHVKTWIEEHGRLADSHLDDDGIFGYSKEEFEAMQKQKVEG